MVKQKYVCKSVALINKIIDIMKNLVKIFVTVFVAVSIGSLFFVACNNEDDSVKKDTIYPQQQPESKFFYEAFPKKVNDQDAKYVLECCYINEKEGYSDCLSRGFDNLDDACNHMQSCIKEFPETKWYDITINGVD